MGRGGGCGLDGRYHQVLELQGLVSEKALMTMAVELSGVRVEGREFGMDGMEGAGIQKCVSEARVYAGEGCGGGSCHRWR